MDSERSTSIRHPWRAGVSPLAVAVVAVGVAYEATLWGTTLLAAYRMPIPYAVPVFDGPFVVVGIGIAYLCLERHRLRQDFPSIALGAALFLASLLAVAHVLAQPDYPGTPGVHAGVAPYFFFSSYLAALGGVGLAAHARGRAIALTDRSRLLIAVGVVFLACAFAVAVVVARPLLPALIMPPGRLSPFAVGLGGIANGAVGAWALWVGRHAVLRRDADPFTRALVLAAVLWLIGLMGFLIFPYRYSVSWYVSGLVRPVGITLIFVALVREQVALYREKAALHAELTARLLQLQDAQDRLLQADKLAALGTLLSGVSHELNNPLSTISLSLQLAQQQLEQPGALGRRLAVAQEECDRALRIIRDLLQLARRQPPERQPVDANAIVRAAVSIHAPELDRCRIDVVTDLDEVPPIWADPHQLQQVLLNLFVNASQAMRGRDGRGELTVRSRTADGAVQLEVEDNGPGIPAEHLGRVFDPFFTTKRAGEGTGLGLSVSLGIVQAHGGELRALNGRAGGARFILHLPIGDRVAAHGPAAPPTPERTCPGRVLVVDDEARLRSVISDVLATRGHRVEEASSGQDALAKLRRARYDVVTLDLRLPDLDGVAVWRWLVSHDPDAARRVVFMTGDTISDDTRTLLRDTGQPVLVKPFSIDRVLAVVETALATAPEARRA